jgi:putative peptidoglycan lipid II flippase
LQEFAGTVNSSIYKMLATALLVSSFMMAAALPLIDLVYRRGRLHFADSQVTAIFFFWFSLSLAFWAIQGLYARAFYAAGNTFTPMLASTIITLASLPLYWILFQRLSTVGLVVASDLGIATNCITMAVLLHRRRLVPISGLPWKEIGKTFSTAVVAGVGAIQVARFIPLRGSRLSDAESLGLTAVTWAAAVALGLWLLKSRLPGDLRRRGMRGQDAAPSIPTG